MVAKPSVWICCQLGAREHYAIPRALHKAGQLNHLITDAWVSPSSALSQLPRAFLASLRDRFHTDLAQASVHAFTGSLVRFEIAQRIQKSSGWQPIIARNYWFQRQAVQLLDNSITPRLNSRPTLFAYSYAALELLRYAKTRGWRTILGQIDPGPVEENLVLEEHTRHSTYQSNWQPAPPEYWFNWQEECSLADRIIVNSLWSSQALQQAGIPANKIDIIPLAYEPPQAYSFVRTYPLAFSAERPLRVLFLGQVNLRKGIAALLEAVELLRDQLIEFWLVGSQDIAQPSQDKHSRIRWIGSIPRSATAKYYQLADVFVFPTLSDGFGLTQLEAHTWKLPIIASRYCGEVVQDRVNGLILREVTGEAIAESLLFCLNNPQSLEAFARNTNISCFGLSQLQHYLQTLPYAVV